MNRIKKESEDGLDPPTRKSSIHSMQMIRMRFTNVLNPLKDHH